MLKILYPGIRVAKLTLASASFTRQNYGAAGMTSTRVTSATPDGALGGMWGQMTATDYETEIFTGAATNQPVGMFLNDAVGEPYENTPAVASGKITVMFGNGVYETDLYETSDDDEGALSVAYAPGVILYVSEWGMLTTDNSTSAIQVAVCTSAPTGTSGDIWLGFQTLR